MRTILTAQTALIHIRVSQTGLWVNLPNKWHKSYRIRIV